MSHHPGFLAFFPVAMGEILRIELAIQDAEAAQEVDYAQRLRDMHSTYTRDATALGRALGELDAQLRFLGGPSPSPSLY